MAPDRAVPQMAPVSRLLSLLLIVAAGATCGCRGPDPGTGTGEDPYGMSVGWQGGVRRWELRDAQTGETWRGSDASER